MSNMASCEVGGCCFPVKKGRTWRRRKRKCKNPKDCKYTVDCFPALVNLSKWMKNRCSGGSLKPRLKAAVFRMTGRGLMTVRGLKTGDIVVQVPREAMITCSDVFSDEKLSYPLKYLNLKLKAMEVLSIFLLHHRWLGAQSEWKHYIDSLPVTYTVPSFCTEKEIRVMPEFLKTIVQSQEDDLQSCFEKAQKMFGLLCVKNSCCYLPSLTDIRWAWFTVNTRAVYMKNSYPNPTLVDEDICALAPYLDLLNHSHTAQVETGLSEDGEFYQIKTLVPYGPYEQVFINYGPHDNIKLYKEYGFILPDNPHSSVPFILDELLDVMKDCDAIENAHARKDLLYEKQMIIVSHNFHKNLAMSSDGPSWNFEVATTILLMTADELSQWQVVYQNLTGMGHRHLVQCCLRMLCQSKLDHFNLVLMNMEDIEDCSEAFACAKMLVRDCCLILTNAEKSLQC